MATTSYKDTGAILTSSGYIFRINGQLNYDVSRTNNTLTFTNVWARIQYYSTNGGGSFSYPAGWDVVGQVPSGTQRVSGNWSGSRNVGQTNQTSTAGSFTVGVGKDDTSINVRVGARYAGDPMTYTTNTSISIPALGNPVVSSHTVSDIKQKSAKITVTGTGGTNGTISNVKVEWGLTTGYGNEITDSSSPYEFNLTNLSAGKLYYYRVTITNGGGKTGQATGTFKTKAVAGMLPVLMGLLNG